MISELVLATRNRHKGEELASLLDGLAIQIHTLTEFPDAPDVIEDGETCEENAIKKARAIAQATGLPTVADDTGLEVDALDGRPGVYAARYAGEHVTYEENCRKLLRELTGVPVERRTARFRTVAALAVPNEGIQTTHGILEGMITEEPRGTGGFGYDPVFFVPDIGLTLAELPSEKKNQISHRAKALFRLRELLRRDHSVQAV